MECGFFADFFCEKARENAVERIERFVEKPEKFSTVEKIEKLPCGKEQFVEKNLKNRKPYILVHNLWKNNQQRPV